MPNRPLETAALNRVIEYLHNHGESVTIVDEPDDARRGKPQPTGVKTPDVTLMVDGREVSADITEIYQHAESVRQFLALGQLTERLEERMRVAVRAAGLGTVIASAGFSELPPRRGIDAVEQLIFDRLVSTLPLLRGPEHVEVEGLPSFIGDMQLSIAGARSTFGWVFHDELHGGWVVSNVIGALDRTIKKKRSQLAAAKEGWLIVVDQTLLGDEEDFAQAIPLLTEPIPENWRRLFVVLRRDSGMRVVDFRLPYDPTSL